MPSLLGSQGSRAGREVASRRGSRVKARASGALELSEWRQKSNIPATRRQGILSKGPVLPRLSAAHWVEDSTRVLP